MLATEFQRWDPVFCVSAVLVCMVMRVLPAGAAGNSRAAIADLCFRGVLLLFSFFVCFFVLDYFSHFRV